MNEVGVTETLTDTPEPAPNFMEAPIQETTPEPQPAVEIKVTQPAKKEEVHKRTVTL